MVENWVSEIEDFGENQEVKNTKIIEKLPPIVKGKYWSFSLVERDENFAIYKSETTPTNYEVFKIRKIDAKKTAESFNKRFGCSYDIESTPDLREKYPVDKDFGFSAWSYNNMLHAKEQFELLKKEKLDEK